LLISFSSFGQDETEEDYRTIRSTEEQLFTGNKNWDSLSVNLSSIISKTPKNYKNSFKYNNKNYYKFWNDSEFDEYKREVDPSINFFPNIYPFACYLLAIIEIERGNFDSAMSVLNFGIELQPDHPTLLSELGFLFQRKYKLTKESSLLLSSNNFFSNAISSREFNTASQKARALRGLGYNFIDLNDLFKAKKYYQKSLKLIDSKIARNEINLINQMLEDKSIKPITNLSSIDQSSELGLEYLEELVDKQPENIQHKYPSEYTYIWLKAMRLHKIKTEVYREEDYFKYPLKEWNINQIRIGVEQIVFYLKGFTIENYLEVNTLKNAEELLKTFHFEIMELSIINNNISKIMFRHKMDESEISLYFKFKN
jgi:tetratricopeptide (TPR) repeat protein